MAPPEDLVVSNNGISATLPPKQQAKRRGYEPVTLNDVAADENDNDLITTASHEEPFAPAAAHHDDHSEQIIEQLVSIDDAVEMIGYGIFQFRILIATGLCFAADAMQVVCVSFLSPLLQHEWQLSTDATASLASSLFAGSVVGTLVLGPLADIWGRRPVFGLAAGTISVAGCGAALAPSYSFMLLALFVIGLGVGGLVVPFDILAEFLPTQGRGTRLLMIEYFWTVGCLYVVGVVYVFVENWRVFVALCTVPCFLSLAMGWVYVPESPRWLAEQEGRLEEAADGLKVAAKVNGKSHDPFRLQPPEHQHNASVMELFTPRWRNTVLCLWATWAASAFGYYGTLMTITRVFESETQKGSEDFDFSAIFISNGAEVVGVTMVILLVDRIGRIPSQVLSYALSGIFLLALCWGDTIGFSRQMLISLGFGARVFVMAGTCVTWVSTAEILTTEVRSTGHSIANALAKIGATVCPYVVESDLGLKWIGVILFGVQVFAALCVSQLPETAGRGLGGAAAVDEGGEAEEGAEAAALVDGDVDEEHEAEPVTHNGEFA